MTHADAHRPATCHREPKRATLQAGVTVILALAMAGTALAQQGPDDRGIACSVSGYDVIIRNEGTDPIASGASVNWSVPFARVEGSHVLTAVLDPGGRVFLTGALGSNFLGSDAECVTGPAGQPDQPVGGDNAPAPPAN